MEELTRRTIKEEKLQIPVILSFMVEESEAKEVNLALDLVLSSQKDGLSRSQALVYVAHFYLEHCRPVSQEVNRSDE